MYLWVKCKSAGKVELHVGAIHGHLQLVEEHSSGRPAGPRGRMQVKWYYGTNQLLGGPDELFPFSREQ